MSKVLGEVDYLVMDYLVILLCEVRYDYVPNTTYLAWKSVASLLPKMAARGRSPVQQNFKSTGLIPWNLLAMQISIETYQSRTNYCRV